MKTIRMEEMTWPAVRAAIAAGCTTVVAAVGSSEQHGPHLPTMTDTRIGEEIARRVAARLGNALVARTIAVGCSDHHLAFGATISLQPETLKMVVRDYIASLVRDGFTRLVFIPSHGGNFAPLAEALAAGRVAHPQVEIVGFTDLWAVENALTAASAAFGVSAAAAGAHAGENETAMMLALEPELVERKAFAAGYVGPLGEEEFAIILERGMPALTENGVLGDPRGATAERGEAYLERWTDFIVTALHQPH